MRHVRIPANRARPPLRVLLLLGNWIGGGAERVAVHLMNRLPPQWDVRLGLLNASGAYFDQLDAGRVHVAPGGDRRFRYDRPNAELFDVRTLASGAVNAPRAFRRMIDDVQPDVVMSFLKGTAILTWLALAGRQARPAWIAREGNNISAVAEAESPNPLVRAASLQITRLAYRRADAVLANAARMAAALPDELGVDPGRVHTIHNPVDVDMVQALAAEPADGAPRRPYVIAVGRLEYQKGHEFLIEAFARAGAVRTHDLVILGQGSREAELRALAVRLGVGHAVHFPGFCANPHAWVARADLFAMPSRWEGFPNAAAEAMAAGAPLLLSDCAYGPSEIVSHGEDGLLVPPGDVGALAQSLALLLARPDLRRRFAAQGQIKVRRFAVETMVNCYADLIQQVSVRTRSRASAPLRFAPA